MTKEEFLLGMEKAKRWEEGKDMPLVYISLEYDNSEYSSERTAKLAHVNAFGVFIVCGTKQKAKREVSHSTNPHRTETEYFDTGKTIVYERFVPWSRVYSIAPFADLAPVADIDFWGEE